MFTYPKIFLSHSHNDRQFATELQKILEDQGGETYLDQDKIQAGDILPGRTGWFTCVPGGCRIFSAGTT